MNVFSKKRQTRSLKQFIMTLYRFLSPCSQTYGTWRKQADGHQQHMFLLLQVELLQAHLELHQWLQQLQSVARYRECNTSLLSVQHIESAPCYIIEERPSRECCMSCMLCILKFVFTKNYQLRISFNQQIWIGVYAISWGGYVDT